MDFRNDPAGVLVDLSTGTPTDGWGDTNTLTDIKRIEGTSFDDVIIGDDEDNSLRGRDGDDSIVGGDGNDDLSGAAANNTLEGCVGGDFRLPGAGTDLIIGWANGPLFEDDELSYYFDSKDLSITPGVSVTLASETDGTAID